MHWSLVCILIGWTTACGSRTPLPSGADTERDRSLGGVSGAGSTTCAWDLTPVQSYPANPSPDAIAAADFDGDGRIDVALGSPNDGSLAVLRNDGTGRFEPPVIYKGGQPSSVATGDFDRDGRTDIVVGGGNGGPLGMYHNLGHGTFVDSAHYVTGGYPDAIAANDLDHDGTLDLVTANNTSGTLSVLFNAGDGSFRNQVPLLVGSRPASVAAGDFDDDGRPDLVSTSWGYLGTTSVLTGASVLRNLGGGRFDTPLLYDAGPAPEQLAIADFDGDGELDIACGSLLRRTFALDVETCPRCGGRMRLMRPLRAASEG